VWYSVLAAVGQWGLHKAAMLSPMMVNNNEVLGGIMLIAAGIFQFSSLKYACLKRCRSPLGFLLNEWQEGRRGAFLMGLRNGNYCVGCCWALMLLMLVAGTMNLLWMAIIAGFILVEKVAPAGRLVGYLSGFILIAWGVWMLAGKIISY
jgi:predicted metal-binding membrane protein